MTVVFDIDDVQLEISLVDDSITPDNDPPASGAITDIGEDGFGITPGGENTVMQGLNGPIGFNIDPATSGEAALNVKPSSNVNPFLYEAYQKNYVLKFTIHGDVNKHGFKYKQLGKCVVQKPPEISVQKEFPDLTWTFVGYEYKEVFTDTEGGV